MKLTALSAGIEAVTGVALVVDPSLVTHLLLGADLSAGGQAVGRVAGFALFSLGLACWPDSANRGRGPLRGLLAYNALAAVFFLYVAAFREFAGLLLWPAAALHLVLTILLGRVFIVDRH